MQPLYTSVKVNNEIELCEIYSEECKKEIERALLKNRISYFIRWPRTSIFGKKRKTCIICVNDNSKEEAQDVVQETFVRAWRRMDDLRCVQSEKAWLTRIALNLCRDQQRTRWFRSVIRDETLLDQIPAPEKSDHSEVLEAVGRLPQRLREVIMLHYYENLDAPEMAQILGITPSAVYRRLRQARGKLQILLKGADDDD